MSEGGQKLAISVAKAKNLTGGVHLVTLQDIGVVLNGQFLTLPCLYSSQCGIVCLQNLAADYEYVRENLKSKYGYQMNSSERSNFENELTQVVTPLKKLIMAGMD